MQVFYCLRVYRLKACHKDGWAIPDLLDAWSVPPWLRQVVWLSQIWTGLIDSDKMFFVETELLHHRDVPSEVFTPHLP